MTWMGLHNPERHKAFSGEWAECLPDLGGCLSECGDGDPCRCCLAAEVERLTAALAERDRRIAAALAVCEPIAGDHPDPDIAADYSPLLARDIIEALRGES